VARFSEISGVRYHEHHLCLAGYFAVNRRYSGGPTRDLGHPTKSGLQIERIARNHLATEPRFINTSEQWQPSQEFLVAESGKTSCLR
jgi:hypothetical protein